MPSRSQQRPSSSDHLSRVAHSSSDNDVTLVIPELSFSKATTWRTRLSRPVLFSMNPVTPSHKRNRGVENFSAGSLPSPGDFKSKAKRPGIGERGFSDSSIAAGYNADTYARSGHYTTARATPSWETTGAEGTACASPINTMTVARLPTQEVSIISDGYFPASFEAEKAVKDEESVLPIAVQSDSRYLTDAAQDQSAEDEERGKSHLGFLLSKASQKDLPPSEFRRRAALHLSISVHFADLPQTKQSPQAVARKPRTTLRARHSDPIAEIPTAADAEPIDLSPSDTETHRRSRSVEVMPDNSACLPTRRAPRQHALRSRSEQLVQPLDETSIKDISGVEARNDTEPRRLTGTAVRHLRDALLGSASDDQWKASDMDSMEPQSPPGRRSSRLRTIFSSLLSPRCENPDESVPIPRQAAPQHQAERDDYFSQPSALTPNHWRQPKPLSAPLLGQNSTAAHHSTVPLVLRGLRPLNRAKAAESVVSSPGVGQVRASRSVASSDEFNAVVDEGHRHGIVPCSGPLSDSVVSVQTRLSEEDQRPYWFRQRMDKLLGEDPENTSALSLDWDTPMHLPNSPLCPLNPKYTGNQKGLCVYHGQLGTQ